MLTLLVPSVKKVLHPIDTGMGQFYPYCGPKILIAKGQTQCNAP
jgi:hypothetical protein